MNRAVHFQRTFLRGAWQASTRASVAALERFEGAVRQVLEVQFDDLASEILEIEASPYGRVVVQLGEVERPISTDAKSQSSREVPLCLLRRFGRVTSPSTSSSSTSSGVPATV